MRFRLSSDVGGTFTDLSVFDEHNRSWQAFKSSTTPEDVTTGILDTLHLAAEYYEQSLTDFMAQCSFFSHGSTISTNAIIEHKVAKTGLICTRGFRDLMTHGEITKSGFEWDLDFPEPFIPRYLTLPVTERINAEGGIETALDEEEVVRVIRQFKAYGVEAIAVCLLWSIVNPVHEQCIARIIKTRWPEIPTVTSSEFNPIIREYRRTSSTAINAALIPVIEAYAERLRSRLAAAGYSRAVAMFTSSGGLVGADEIIKRPILSVDSGPAMAPAGARAVAAAEFGLANVITCDMGGTSFDVSVVTDGNIVLSRECKLGDSFLGISKVDSSSIGAGGGSVAWIDLGGMLHVGPQSAGSQPGPVCYDRGGQDPTVTDANAVLGYIDPGYFLGGRMALNIAAAKAAIREKVARPLNINSPEAAFTIWIAINHNMLAALEDLTVKRGIDPREYLLVAGGGAAGMHMHYIARQLGARGVLFPRFAGILSAAGGMFCDAVGEFSSTYMMESSCFDFGVVNTLLAELEQKANAFLQRHDIADEKRRIRFFVEARYPHQAWELDVPIDGNRIRNTADLERLVARFHDIHEQFRGIREPGQQIECVNWKVSAMGELTKPDLKPQTPAGDDPSGALRGTRPVFFKDLGGYVETPIYDENNLIPGNRIRGPAIVESPITTIVVSPQDRAIITGLGGCYIDTGNRTNK